VITIHFTHNGSGMPLTWSFSTIEELATWNDKYFGHISIHRIAIDPPQEGIPTISDWGKERMDAVKFMPPETPILNTVAVSGSELPARDEGIIE
jgi:hypothetical protein